MDSQVMRSNSRPRLNTSPLKSCYVLPPMSRRRRVSETLFSHSYSSLDFHPHLKRTTKHQRQQYQKFSLRNPKQGNPIHVLCIHKNSVRHCVWNTNVENPFKSQNCNNKYPYEAEMLNIHKYISRALSMCFRLRYQRCLLKYLYILFPLTYSLYLYKVEFLEPWMDTIPLCTFSKVKKMQKMPWTA